MSVGTRNPVRVCGGQSNSGLINTGEARITYGGDMTASIYSGQVAPALGAAPGAVATGADVLLYSGAGRLKDVLIHQSLVSGQSIIFYDAGVTSSGGPFPLSGNRILATAPPVTLGLQSGVFQSVAGAYPFDVPFTSGLCFNSTSGQAGFTVSWIPDPGAAFG